MLKRSLICLIIMLFSQLVFARDYVNVEEPRHPELDLPYSTKSDLDGVCRSLGYEEWIFGFNRPAYSGKNIKRVIVDSDGDLIQVEKSFSQHVKSLRCKL